MPYMENPSGSRRKAPHVLNLCYSLMVIVNLKHLFEKLFLKLVQGPGPGSKLKCGDLGFIEKVRDGMVSLGRENPFYISIFF